MAQLRVENIKLSDHFNAEMARLGVTMPIDHHPRDGIEIVDAKGNTIAQIDPYGIMDDDQADLIAGLIILAVNTCGSFRAVAPEIANRTDKPNGDRS